MKLSTKQKQNLRYALHAHPLILQQVGSLSEISALGDERLVEVAAALGIDVAIAKKTSDYGRPHAPDRALEEYCEKNPAFTGVVETTIVIGFFGKSVTRQCRLSYDYTPEWPYFDLKQKKVMHGWAMSSIGLEIRCAEVRGSIFLEDGKFRRSGGKNYWVSYSELLGAELLGSDLNGCIYERIEEECLRENERRLREAARLEGGVIADTKQS